MHHSVLMLWSNTCEVRLDRHFSESCLKNSGSVYPNGMSRVNCNHSHRRREEEFDQIKVRTNKLSTEIKRLTGELNEIRKRMARGFHSINEQTSHRLRILHIPQLRDDIPSIHHEIELTAISLNPNMATRTELNDI